VQHFLATKTLAHQAFDTVASNGLAQTLFADGKPQPGVGVRGDPRQYGKIAISGSAGRLENLREFPGVSKTQPSGKSACLYCQREPDLRGQAGATFATAGADDTTAGFSSHPGAKTMAAFALKIARLKRSFHSPEPL